MNAAIQRRLQQMRVIAILVVTAHALLPAGASANCGAEGCPIAPMGPDGVRGRFALNFGYQQVEQNRLWDGGRELSAAEALAAEGGTGHVLEQLTRTRSWTVDGSARVTERLRIAVSVPYIDRIHRHTLAHHPGFFIDSEWHMRGLGDASAVATWAIPLPPTAGPGSLSLQVGAKVPTGKRQVEEIDGEQPEPSARPGSGSTDGLIGVQYQYRFRVRTPGGARTSLPLTIGTSARLNGVGTDGYRMGNEWMGRLGFAYPLTGSVRLLGQLDASSHRRDEVGSTDAEAHHTGGSVVFASPGLQATVASGVTAFGFYQFRVHQHTNGPQLVSPYHLVFGLGYSLP